MKNFDWKKALLWIVLAAAAYGLGYGLYTVLFPKPDSYYEQLNQPAPVL